MFAEAAAFLTSGRWSIDALVNSTAGIVVAARMNSRISPNLECRVGSPDPESVM